MSNNSKIVKACPTCGARPIIDYTANKFLGYLDYYIVIQCNCDHNLCDWGYTSGPISHRLLFIINDWNKYFHEWKS